MDAKADFTITSHQGSAMSKTRHYCGFCGKKDDEVERMLSGPCIEVCNECVDMMHKMIHEPKPVLPVKLASGEPRVVVPFKKKAR